MPLHHQIPPPPHVHHRLQQPSASAAQQQPVSTNGCTTTSSASRMAAAAQHHHHHGIPMPPPPVMLSMPPHAQPPPPVTSITSTSHMAPHNSHMHLQHQPFVHHHSPNMNGGSSDLHHTMIQQGPSGISHHHHHQQPVAPPAGRSKSSKNQVQINKVFSNKVKKNGNNKHPPDKTVKSSVTQSNSRSKPQPLMTTLIIPQEPHHHQQPTYQASTTTMTNQVPPVQTTTQQQAVVVNDDNSSQAIKEKTPMCLINELARYNKIQHQYRLTDEAGPPHKKTFTVCLKLGDTEEYIASGPSIKKAQHAAAAIALEKTKLKHPPPKSRLVKNLNITPTVELNALAMKRGEPAVYTFLDTVRPQGQQIASGANAFNYRGMFNQRYHGQQPKNSPQPTTSAVFRVRLTVGNVEVTGEGSTAQAAKHAAATNALQKLREAPLPVTSSSASASNTSSGKTTIKSNLNPASVPFVPSSAKSTSPTPSPKATSSSAVASSSPVAAVTSSTMASTNSSPIADNDSEQKTGDPSYSELKSPISLVHENALKRNMTVKFEVARETGPPHMRTFLTRCIVGDFVTEGEGNGKKTSKTRAAELMLEKLKELPPLASCQTTPKKKSSSSSTSSAAAAQQRKKSKNLIKLEQKANPDYGQSINPISRLIQIQQAKKQKEPVYTLIAERGMPRRREFVMEVSAAGQSAQGSGPNKKLAKRAAAEALLQIMGYSRPTLQPAKPALKTSNSNGSTASSASSSTMSTASVTANGEVKTTSSSSKPSEKPKKLTFVDQVKAGDEPRTNGDAKIPGILYLDPNAKKQETPLKPDGNSSSGGKLINGYGKSSASADEDTKILEPKEELQYLSEVLGFQVTFTDFPQKAANNTSKKPAPEFITLVKLSTKPPKVCHGKGSSRQASQSDAARRALLLLADSGDNLNQDQEDNESETQLNGGGMPTDTIPIVSAAASTTASASASSSSATGGAILNSDDSQD